MKVFDINGKGEWSRVRVRERYAGYCIALGLTGERDLQPTEHNEDDKKWIGPILDKVIEGIVAADAACIAIGIDLIEEDQFFPFGRILKSDTARALRRHCPQHSTTSPPA